MILSLYAGGVTVRYIGHHLRRTLGAELSHETMANVAVVEEVAAWQSRPLAKVYPIVYLDALVIKVNENTSVRQRVRAPGRRR